jgi:hypothetical protein
MRMRHLGKGHLVMFFAPAEVDRCMTLVSEALFLVEKLLVVLGVAFEY